MSVDPAGNAQGAAIAQFSEQLGLAPASAAAPSPLATKALPDLLTVAELDAAFGAFGPGADGADGADGAVGADRVGPTRSVCIGVYDSTRHPVVVDLTWSHFVVAGGARSGRSSTLSTCARGLAATHRLWGIGPASSLLDQALLDVAAFGRADVIAPLVDRLVDLIEGGPAEGMPHVLLIDDLDTFDDALLNPSWDRLSKLEGLSVIASIETRSLTGYSTNPLLTALRRARRLLVLRPDDANEILQATGVKAPLRPGQRMIPGRGVFVSDRTPHVVQVALHTP